MSWPNIFFKAKTPHHRPAPSASSADATTQEIAKPTHPGVPKTAAEPSPKSASKAMAATTTLRTVSRSGDVHLVKRSNLTPRPEIAPPSAKTAALPTQTPPAEKKKTESAGSAHTGQSPSTPPGSNRIKPVRRKARLADFARMILPPKRLEAPPTVIPASFPVSVAAGSVLQSDPGEPTKKAASPAIEISLEKKTPAAPAYKPAEPQAVARPIEEVKAAASVQEVTAASGATISASAGLEVTSEKPVVLEPKAEPVSATTSTEAPKADSTPKTLGTAPALPEKREFLLANGERIYGRVLSESPDAIYLEHTTLGVLTLPRAQIAKRLVEIILINGDRIVGDIVAETPECLFVRHASLGMLTVPQAQRSTRVVEAILKDGDRILGEVLAETDTYTVIRSASLGTITVKHDQVAMLNRKLEQVELKALPASAPALENKAVS